MDITLGLDISTTSTGIAYSINRIPQFATYIKHHGDNYDKLEQIKQLLIKLPTPTHIYIEAPLMYANNAVTVSKLNFFNGMVTSLIYTLYHIKPLHISSLELRKSLLSTNYHQITKLKGDSLKQYLLNYVTTNYPYTAIFMDGTKGDYDSIDAIITSLYVNKSK